MDNKIQFKDSEEVDRADGKMVLNAVAERWSDLQYASPILLQDENFIRECLLLDPRTIRHVPSQVLDNNYELAYYSLRYVKNKKRFITNFISEKHYSSPAFLLGLTLHIESNEWYEFVKTNRPDLFTSREFCVHAITADNRLLFLMEPAFRSDPELVRLLLSQQRADYSHLELIDWKLFESDESLVKCALELRGELLQNFSRNVKRSKELVKLAVQSQGKSLQYASQELLTDRSFIINLMELDGNKFIPAVFSDDEEIVSMAVSRDGEALQYASERLRADFEIAQTAVQNCCDAYRFADINIRGNRDFTISAIESNGFLLKFVPPPLNRDRDLIITGLSNLSMLAGKQILEYIPQELLNDKEVICALLQNHSIDLLECVPAGFKNDSVIERLIAETMNNHFEYKDLLRDVDESWWVNE